MTKKRSSIGKVIADYGKRVMSFIGEKAPIANARILFVMRTKSLPHLRRPRTFNDKTTWLKIKKYNSDSLVVVCADKYNVREYVASKGCGEILNDLYGVYDKFNEIDFDKLPRRFVIKCVHGSAYNVIVNDKEKMNIADARRKVEKYQKEIYGYATSELYYTKIKPRIIVEKNLCDENGKMPVDYKFYCINGRVQCVLVCSERDEKLRLSYYDISWNRLPYEKKNWSSTKTFNRPKEFDRMIEYAEKLSKDFPFVRVDLYNDNGKIIFGELTFTPACACAPYYTKEANIKLGELLKLDERNGNE